MKEKKYDIYFENSVKVKSLNDDYFKCYQEIEKTLFKKQKNVLKTNILISEILDCMLICQEKGQTVKQMIGQSSQSFVDQINRKINYKEKINQLKQKDLNKYEMSGILLTMCIYIVLLFVKELIGNHYLINYYIDLLVAVIMLCISIKQLLNQRKLIKRYQVSIQPFVLEISSIVISLISIVFYNSPLISLCYISNRHFLQVKMYSKSLKVLRIFSLHSFKNIVKYYKVIKMEKEIILENLDESIVNEATFYSQQNIPSQISQALYLYGSTTDYQVLGFIDASGDGSKGMIFTDQGIYFCFKEPHSFLYEDIEEVVLIKKEEGFDFYAKIKTKANTFVFKNKYLNLKGFIECLSEILEMPVHYEMSAYEKVGYFVPIVLNDLKEDVYEDLELNEQHFQQIKDIEHELEMAKELKDLDYQDECRSLCRYCLDFFESLGLDSDEIDALNEAQSFFDQQDSQENQQLEGAKRWVDETMSNYQNGDTEMYDQMKSTMESLGIDEERLKNMSNEEVDQYIKEMCKKFGISQSLFDKLKDKFGR